MRLFEQELELPAAPGGQSLIEHISQAVSARLDRAETAVRLVITESDNNRLHCELSVLSERGRPPGDALLRFARRSVESTDRFNAVLLVPTGIGAEIGGHAGDATPVASLLASVCDTLVVHPNVVNASDIVDIPSNALYVEGSVVARLLMGTAGLQRVRSNRVLVVLGPHEDRLFTDGAINSVNAARSSYGLDCPRIVKLSDPLEMTSHYSSSGRAAGEVEGVDGLMEALDEHRDSYDAVAISSVITVPRSYHVEYFGSGGKMVNPWGGVEAMLTHALSTLYEIPTAHSPMLESQDVANIDTGVVDPRMAAEIVSVTFLQSVLKGLQRSPRIVSDQEAMRHPAVMTASDVACVVIPDGCVGLPTLAALEQGIRVIAVRENKNLMANDLTELPWAAGQLVIVANYWEAAGVMAAMKAGLEPASVRRPLPPAVVEQRSRRVGEPVPELAERLSPF